MVGSVQYKNLGQYFLALLDRVRLKPLTFQVTYFHVNESSHRNAGNSIRAKVPSSPKGKLGLVHTQNVNTTHTISEQNIIEEEK